MYFIMGVVDLQSFQQYNRAVVLSAGGWEAAGCGAHWQRLPAPHTSKGEIH